MNKSRFSFVSLTAAALAGGLVSYVVFDHFRAGELPHDNAILVEAPPPAPAGCTYVISRVNGFEMVKPVLSSEPLCESPRFEPMRKAISGVIDSCRSVDLITSASVYVREFHNAEWTAINGDEPYDPGSLLKIPILLTYLAWAEEDPSLMGRTWPCEQADILADQGKEPIFLSEQAQLNVNYGLAKLFELMITHSDNRATSILLRHMDQARFIRTFTSIGLPPPDVHSAHYEMNVKHYSMFMKALYNSSFLSPVHSGYALGLLARSTFKDGLIAGLPPKLLVAHKFGEAGTDEAKQLHETALVYAPGNTYLITVMTRGTDLNQQAKVLAAVSRLVYKHMSSSPLASATELAGVAL
jgi:beta-lactamase class A